jgi:hypothetical protein
MWKHIIAFCESEGVDHFTEDLGMRFLDRRYNFSELERTGALTQSIVNTFRVVRMIGDFQQHGSILRRYYKQKELLQHDGFKAILQNFENHCRQREYARVTQKHYRDTSEQFLSYVESQGIKHIADITGKQVAGYINTLLGYSYKTVELQLCALRSFFGYSVPTSFIKRIWEKPYRPSRPGSNSGSPRYGRRMPSPRCSM